jgi:hypothetical protein
MQGEERVKYSQLALQRYEESEDSEERKKVMSKPFEGRNKPTLDMKTKPRRVANYS